MTFNIDKIQELINMEIQDWSGFSDERFGPDFKPTDQLFFDSIKVDAMVDEDLKQHAKVNTPKNFELIFKKIIEDLFINRMDQNEQITAHFMNEKEFKEIVTQKLQ